MADSRRRGGYVRDAAPPPGGGGTATPAGYRRRFLGLAILIAAAFGGDWSFAVMGAATAYFLVAWGDLVDSIDPPCTP